MAHLPATGRSHATGLAHRGRREEVVEVKPPVLVVAEAVNLLRIRRSPQSCRRDRLGLPAGEQGGPVSSREEAAGAGDGADRLGVAPVLPHAVCADHGAQRVRLAPTAREPHVIFLRQINETSERAHQRGLLSESVNRSGRGGTRRSGPRTMGVPNEATGTDRGCRVRAKRRRRKCPGATPGWAERAFEVLAGC